MDGPHIIRTEGITFKYNSRQDTPSLDSVSIGIHSKVRTVILGANGAGKSTLFYHFNGVLRPTEGTVFYRERPLVYEKDDLSKLRSEVSFVVQNPDEQIFSSTVEEDVAFGPLNTGMDREEVDRRVEDALMKVGMTKYRKKPTVQLSYGQRKRVAMAGALALDSEVLILDEPTAGLDPQITKEIMELIDQLCCSGTTVIISTHDVDLAYSWAEEIHVLRKGHLVFSGIPEDFFKDPLSVALAGLAVPALFSMDEAVSAIKRSDRKARPRTGSQLLAKMGDGCLGRLTLIPYDGGEIAQPDGVVGVFGFKSRRMFDEKGLRAEYYFDGLESCLCDVVCGKDSTLVFDIGMSELVTSRVEELRRFGHAPEASR